jgi:hypothetical protein
MHSPAFDMDEPPPTCLAQTYHRRQYPLWHSVPHIWHEAHVLVTMPNFPPPPPHSLPAASSHPKLLHVTLASADAIGNPYSQVLVYAFSPRLRQYYPGMVAIATCQMIHLVSRFFLSRLPLTRSIRKRSKSVRCVPNSRAGAERQRHCYQPSYQVSRCSNTQRSLLPWQPSQQ